MTSGVADVRFDEELARPRRGPLRRGGPRRAGRRDRTARSSVTSGPKRTRHGRIARAERSAGRDRDRESTGARVIACMSGSGGVPGTGAQPRRRERDGDEVPGAHARREVARAVGRSRRAGATRPPTNGHGRRADRRGARRPVARCTATRERGRLDDAEAAVRDERPRRPVRGHVLLAGDVDADERADERRATRSARCGSRPNGSIGIAAAEAPAERRGTSDSVARDVVDVEPVVVRRSSRAVAHAHCLPARSGSGRRSAHSNSSRSTSCVGPQVA